MKVTHSFEVGEVLVHLGVAEDGVTLTHSPQHSLKGLHLHALDETRHKAAAGRQRAGVRVQLPGCGFADISGSPQLGSESLHAGAACH